MMRAEWENNINEEVLIFLDALIDGGIYEIQIYTF